MLSDVRLRMAFPACKSLNGTSEISYRVSCNGTNALQYTWLSTRLKYRGQFLVNTKDSVLKGNWKIYGMNDRNCFQKAKFLFLCPISRASKSEVQECPTDHKEVLSDPSTPLCEGYSEARRDALCVDKGDKQNSDPFSSCCCPSIFLHSASGSCRGLANAAKYACNDAKFMNERARNDIVLLSRGITKLNDRARQDVAILGLEFLKLDARAREDTGKIDSNVKQKAAYLQRIAEGLTDQAQTKLRTAAAKHWNDGALEADLRRVDLRARRRAMEDALMALEFVKNVHDMMVRTMYQVPGNAQIQGEKSLVEGLTIEKKGKAFIIFPGKVSDDQITAIQDAYWSMASALEEADGIDYTNPDDLELLVATLLDMDAIDGKSGASLLAECSRSPDVGTRSPYWQGMIDAVTICGAGFKAPTESELSGNLLDEMVEDMKAELEEHRLEWVKRGCTIMTDGWTDMRNRTLLNFLVSCGGTTMFIKSVDASNHVKNATYLCELIEEVIAEVGEANVVQVVADNAANYVAAGKLLMERHPTIFWSPCAAHCLDLMLEDIGKLEWVKACVEKAKNVCKFIYNHALVLSTMRKYTKQRELARPGITRFASNFITLQSILKVRVELRSMFVGPEWTASSFATTTVGIDVVNTMFDENGFWLPAAEICKVCEPLVSLLRIADGEKPSMGYIYEGMDRVKEAIRSQYAGVQEKYEPIWEIIDRRWQNQLHRPIHAAAYYLNPAFRFRPDFKADDEVYSGLFTVLQKMGGDVPATTRTIELDKFNYKEGVVFSSSMAIEGRSSIQPDRWWETFGSSVPTIQRIAIRILSQPSSASGCERNWSMFEHIHSKRRNRLSVQRLNDLVFVHYNLRLRTRQILDPDSSPITLDEVDPESEWLIEATDPVFTEEDHDWVDQADREAEAVAIAEEELRSRSGTGRRTRTRRDSTVSAPATVVQESVLPAGAMATQSSRTYLRHLVRRQNIDYSEAEVEAAAELEDDDSA